MLMLTTDPPNATLMLVLAIVGIVMCAPLGLTGCLMARSALKQYPNSGTTKAAFWVGLIAVILWAIGIAIWGIIAVVAVASSAGSQ